MVLPSQRVVPWAVRTVFGGYVKNAPEPVKENLCGK